MKTKTMKLSALKREMLFGSECRLSEAERQQIWASYQAYDAFLALEDIIPYDKNPRLNEDAVAGVAESIRNYGFQQPLVLDIENTIIVGHTRRLAAKSIGLAVLPVVIASNLTPEQVKAYRLDDNKTGELSTWDFTLLQDELFELQDAEYDMTTLAFSEEEMNRLLNLAEENPGSDEATEDAEGEDTGIEAEESSAATADGPCDSVIGGIYQLGKHRLACGDGCDGLLVARLFENDGATPVRMLFADIQAGGLRRPNTEKSKSKRSRKADQLSGEEFAAFACKVFTNCMAYLGPGDSFYVFHAPLEADVCWKALKENDGEVTSQVIWAKNHFTQSIDCYMSKHTPIFFGRKHGGSPKWYGKHDSSTTTIQKWDMDDFDKPVEMLDFFLKNSSRPDEMVMDLFSRSSACVLACEAAGRICRSLAQTPQIADLIRRQWAEQVHGKGCDWAALTRMCAQVEKCD